MNEQTINNAIRYRIVCERCGEVVERRAGDTTERSFISGLHNTGWDIINAIVLCPACSKRKDNI